MSFHPLTSLGPAALAVLGCAVTLGCRGPDRARPSPEDTPPIVESGPPAGLPADRDLPTTTRPDIAVANLTTQIEELERRIKHHPRQGNLYEKLVSMLLARAKFLATLGDYDRAHELAETYVRIAPGKADSHIVRASVRARLHRFDAALADLDEAQRLGAHSSRTIEARAGILQSLGKHDEARAIIERIAAGYPGFASHAALANLHAELGDIEPAAAAFRKAIEAHARIVSPFTLAWVCFRWGRMLETAGQGARARYMYELALDRLPRYADAAAHLAGILASTGDRQAAATLLRELVGRSDNPEYVGQLAALEQSLGNHERASELAARATADYESLLGRFPDAFADHAARYFLGIGNDAPTALELARRNLQVRATAASHALAIEAALAAGASDEACDIARSAIALPRAPQQVLFQAWRAFSGCGATDQATALEARLGMKPAPIPAPPSP